MVIIPATLLNSDHRAAGHPSKAPDVGGKDLKLTRYQPALRGRTGRPFDRLGRRRRQGRYLAEVPSQSAAYVREGFEALRKPEVKDPLLSRPEFNIKEEANVRVAMRDGVKLATDVYRPEKEGKHPAILVRTPYKKEFQGLTGKYYARRGYVVAVQDCRGRFSSEGVWEPFVNEPQDGYDTVEWLAKLGRECNGKVGMIGGSYVGWVQWWAAVERPPHLVTIIPNVSPPDPFYNIPYEYGTFFLWGRYLVGR